MSPLFSVLRKQSFASSGLYLLIFALCLAISATTALKFSNQQIQQAVNVQAAKMQAADLVLSDQYPIEDQWRSTAQQRHLTQSQVTLFSSMAHTDANFVMVNVKAIEPNFPLRGELRVQPAAAQIQSGEVWLSQRAMDLLKLKLSDQVQIADATFKVTALIEHDSNQEMGFAGFSPTVIISQQDVARTQAIQVGSRAEYRLLLAGAAHDVAAFTADFKQQQQQAAESNAAADTAMAVSSSSTATTQAESQQVEHTATPSAQSSSTDASTATLQEDNQSSLKLRTAQQANVRLMKPIENLETFLQLANILTILLCGIAIALSSQRYVQQSQDHIALMRCLGASRGQMLQAYLLLLLSVVAIAIVIGSAAGLGFAYLLLQLMSQLIPQLQFSFSLIDMLIGPLPIAVLTSVVVLLGFVVPSLWELLNTAPIRVLRQAHKSARSWGLMLGAGMLSLIIFSVVLTENISLTAWVMLALIGLSGVLYGVVWLLLSVLKRLRNGFSSYVGVPAQSAIQITALALGLSLMSVLLVLRTDLLERWQQQLPENTPNQFVYALPPYELEPFEQQLKAHAWQTALYPNVRGRLVGINGQAFAADLVKKNNALRRELNLTQTDHYPSDNQILEGKASLQQVGEVSVEAKLAKELGIKIGDQLTFSLPEGELHSQVVNLRQVEWQSFSPNFFFIFAPQTLDVNAGSYLGSFYVPEAQKPQLISLIQQFSNTVFIDVSLILEEIKRLVNVLVQVIGVLALLVSVSGFLVLVACINLLMDARKKQVALLRSFGASKRQLKNMLSIEIGFMGAVAGLMACLLAELISAIVAHQMQLDLQWHVQIWLLLPPLMAVLCALIGRYRLGYLSDLPPLQSLRELNQ